MRLMAQDKKVRRGKLTFILVRGIGEAFVTSDVVEERVRSDGQVIRRHTVPKAERASLMPVAGLMRMSENVSLPLLP